MKHGFDSATFARIRDLQAQAADPERSIWVSANAGSGKTHVLTMRVLRLLLSDVAPEHILCLTYTKAAAAEMRARVAGRLAQWSLLEDDALRDKLGELTNESASPTLLEKARTLFACALETPGGLKIQTIHAFCEGVLHRFPLEAGVPFDFTVLEDADRDAMVLSARERVLAAGLKGGAHGEAIETLFALMTDHAITEAIGTALSDGRKLRPILADREAAKRNLRRHLDVDRFDCVEIEREMMSGRLIGPAEIMRILAVDCGAALRGGLEALNPQSPALTGWLDAFLKADHTVPARLITKAFEKADAQLAALVRDEAGRLAGLCTARKAAQLVQRSEALLDVLGAIHDHYEGEKRARSLMDFDDLIERLGALFADRASGPWVRYKLDAGITHILVDESQDTNPEQWRVVRDIADEFFVGDSAVERPRTLFAVGDEKQSIFSFQGAEPQLFGESGDAFQHRAKAVQKAFDRVRLDTSFRSLQTVLNAVDLVFAQPQLQLAALAHDRIVHHAARPETGGAVTLWPPVRAELGAELSGEWPTEIAQSSKSAPRQVAERIARTVRSWIDARRPLGVRSEPVTANDVMILVQSRGALFNEIIRALHAENLPTPGADRLAVTSHIAVLDLLALGDVLLSPDDDLQLAAILRSPLFDVTEDELFALAHHRPERLTLYRALGQSEIPSCKEAYERLHRWRSQLDFDRPYWFFAQVLYKEGGLRSFHRRFGLEVDDIFAEFLQLAIAHEQMSQPSLQGFVCAMRERAVSIKRELAERGSGVRVMTVHGAKGLEAPIVILADSTSKPSPKQTTRSLYVAEGSFGPILFHAARKDDHLECTMPIREAHEARQNAEYWRKLYVGMTRAEDELFITGALGARDKGEGTWYEAVRDALSPQCEAVPDPLFGDQPVLVYPAERPAPSLEAKPVPVVAPQSSPLSFEPLPPPVEREVIHPSRERGTPMRTLDTSAESTIGAESARKDGIALHALLQHLAKIPPEQRRAVAFKAIPVLLPEAPERHEGLVEKALSILTRPELQDLFGPNARAEVPFAVNAQRKGKPVRLSGRIDRLVVSDDRVLIVDYKSDATPPSRADQVDGNYRVQLGLYALVAAQLFPDKAVSAAILWTSLESLMILPADLVGEASAAFTLE